METCPRASRHIDRMLVLSLPTRDGNKKPKGEYEIVGYSFKPTYKGWKPEPASSSTGFKTACFKPTYKGWKHISVVVAASLEVAF